MRALKIPPLVAGPQESGWLSASPAEPQEPSKAFLPAVWRKRPWRGWGVGVSLIHAAAVAPNHVDPRLLPALVSREHQVSAERTHLGADSRMFLHHVVSSQAGVPQA